MKRHPARKFGDVDGLGRGAFIYDYYYFDYFDFPKQKLAENSVPACCRCSADCFLGNPNRKLNAFAFY